MSTVNIPGISYPFPGKSLVIPPLSLGDLEQLLDRINAIVAGGMDRGSIATVIDATHSALRHNYPDLPREEVAGLLDLRNMREVLNAVMSASGMEAQPVNETGGSAGPFDWGQLYAHLIASTGQSPVTLRRDWDMTMVGHMTDYWRHHPPVHVLVAGYMGYKAETQATDAPDLATNVASLSADLRDELPEHLLSALDTFTKNP